MKMKRYTQKQLIEMSAKELNIPVEQIYSEIDEVFEQFQKEKEEYEKLQYQEYIECCKENGWKIYPKYLTDEYKQKCSENKKLWWKNKKSEKFCK